MSQVLILIAEDESRLAAFVQKGLQKSGYETVWAADGVQAVNLIEEAPVDLVLLDLGLPLKDGWAVLKEVRSRHPMLPIIVVTAMTDERDRAAVLASGANDYVMKPFRFSDLLVKVKQYL
jgi:two-component system, OmpR family, copper resistance phosphate regulon response regulator CusR